MRVFPFLPHDAMLARYTSVWENVCSYCYYGNGERWRRNKYASDFDART